MVDINYQDKREEDERNVARIRQIVDIACMGIATGLLDEEGLEEVIEDTRRKVLAIAPDKGSQFDLIYASRMKRIWEDARFRK